MTRSRRMIKGVRKSPAKTGSGTLCDTRTHKRDGRRALSLRGKSRLPIPPDLPITETIDEVIVYHADRLHVGIHDRRPHETESAMLKVLAERVGYERSRRNLSHDLPSVELWPSVNEAPAIGVEASELFLDFEKGARVAHGGLDLHAVANDLGIQCELLDSSNGKSRDFLRIKPLESAPITLPLLQHQRPAQPSLCTFEHEKLEVPAVIVDRDTPFEIMVLEHQRIIDIDPRAPLDGCGCAAHKDRGLLFLTKM